MESNTICCVTPRPEDLEPYKVHNCSHCPQTFTNLSNLQMHLVKHHKINEKLNGKYSTMNKNGSTFYFCPMLNCIYHEKHPARKHFTTFKYLRQHYQKVHAERKIKCEKCQKSFLNENSFSIHLSNYCGVKYECYDCGWVYNSREALLTHCKRKHRSSPCDKNGKSYAAKRLKSDNQNTNEIPQNTLSRVQLPKYKQPTEILPAVILHTAQVFFKVETLTADRSTQTEEDFIENSVNGSDIELDAQDFNNYGVEMKEISLQTDEIDEHFVNNKETITSDIISTVAMPDSTSNDKNSPSMEFNIYNNSGNQTDTISNCFGDTLGNNSSLCDIETQTEFTEEFLDQILHSNMHTQTCDDFLSELGLADIQTQTTWSSLTGNNDMDAAEDNEGACQTTVAHDEMLVSTETQTSFTQCLLECHTEMTGTELVSSSSSCSGSGVSTLNSIGNTMGITQHTQTCDMLLEGLFGNQGSDLIGGLQSAQTQT